MKRYIRRVIDYANDPLLPIQKWNPLHWVETLWNCLWNDHLYEEDDQ
jgi:hypothetical protein